MVPHNKSTRSSEACPGSKMHFILKLNGVQTSRKQDTCGWTSGRRDSMRWVIFNSISLAIAAPKLRYHKCEIILKFSMSIAIGHDFIDAQMDRMLASIISKLGNESIISFNVVSTPYSAMETSLVDHDPTTSLTDSITSTLLRKWRTWSVNHQK